MVKRIINQKPLSSQDFEVLYPFESHFINVRGHRLHYIDQGTGQIIVMLHGNPTWSFYFRNIIKGLSPQFRCIAPDHIGCGFSDKPSSGQKKEEYSYTLTDRIKDLDFLIKNIVPCECKKINLIIHDWGGIIGLGWALNNLHRIDKIVITNTAGFLLPESKTFSPVLWMIKYLTPLAVPAVLGLNLFAKGSSFLGPNKKLSVKVRRGLTAPYNCWKNRIATLRFVQDIPITSKDLSWPIVNNIDQNLTKLNKDKLLLLWGGKDFIFDLNFYNEFKLRFPGIRSKLFQNAGHYLFEDEPIHTLKLILSFLVD